MTPEAHARQQIDATLGAAGWVVQDLKQLNLGVGLRRPMQKVLRAAFSARLIPQNSNDESASVLQARIHAERDGRTAMSRKLRSDKVPT